MWFVLLRTNKCTHIKVLKAVVGVSLGSHEKLQILLSASQQCSNRRPRQFKNTNSATDFPGHI